MTSNRFHPLKVCVLSAMLGGCLDRDVYTDEPRGVRSAAAPRLETQPAAAGVDILFVVDDSVSMADKQSVLIQSLNRLAGYATRCISPTGEYVLPVNGVCPTGYLQNSLLLIDGSQAVITSSLEAGGSACGDTTRRARPLPEPTVEDSIEHGGTLGARIAKVGESGCGYESPLEAMYRFLVDPEPPLQITVEDAGDSKSTVIEGVDEELLAQRARFLHPYSQVVIIILTDEDDCSVSLSTDAWQIGSETLARGTAICETAPLDACCRPCDAVETEPPEGCPPLAEDPACVESPTWSADEDSLNLRCWDQKRRFGKDWLFSTERYVRALTEASIVTGSGETVKNPLFEHGRTPDMISVMVLGGVPWQLITSSESQVDQDTMEFMTPRELRDSGAWPRLLGDPDNGVEPTDMHLVSSVAPRPGLPGPDEDFDPIHGHEVNRTLPDDLQYSCIFALPEPRDCEKTNEHCECDGAPELPLCRQANGAYGELQRYAKAYPPPRLLSFVQGMENRGYLGSICPRQLDRPDQSGFGYSDALRLLHEETFGYVWDLSCFYLGLPTRSDGSLNCKLLEFHEGPITCEEHGRLPVDSKYRQALLNSIKRQGTDGTVCEIPPMPGDPEDPESPAFACLNELHPSTLQAEGYCYIDADRQLGNPELVAGCTPKHRRRVRLIPQNLPLPGTITELICDYGEH